jgi:Fur family transcriptional regulator, ferric uptake regulator
MAESWQAVLRSKGYRLTPQRELVLQAVKHLTHGTPDEVLTEVQRTASGVNISTVYRTLELLEELGLVTHTHLGHGAPTYHAVSDDAGHLHLVCRDCGRVIETPVEVADSMVEALSQRYGFETDVTHVALFGRCTDCRHGGSG